MEFMHSFRQVRAQTSGQSKEETKCDKGYVRRIQPKEQVGSVSDVGNEDRSESEIVRILGRARPSFVVDLVSKGDELTEDDIEIISKVQEHIEDEQKEQVKEEQVDTLLCTLSKCYITGCEVHTLIPQFVHYTKGINPGYPLIASMDKRMKKGYELYLKNKDCSFIEVYQRHLCVVRSDGTTTVINE